MNQSGKLEQGIAVILLIVLLAWAAYAEELNQVVNEIAQPPAETPIVTPETPAPNPEPIPPTEPIPIPEPSPQPEPEPVPVPPTLIPQIEIASPLEGETITGTLILIPKFNFPEQISQANFQVLGESFSFQQDLLKENNFIGDWNSETASNGDYRIIVHGCIEQECTDNTVNIVVKNEIPEPEPIPIPVPDENQVEEQKFSIIPSNITAGLNVFDLNGAQIASSSEKIELQKGIYNATLSFIDSPIKGMEINSFNVENDFTFVQIKEDFELDKTTLGLDENSFIIKTVAFNFGTNFVDGKTIFNYVNNATALFECKEFDFENISCKTDWIKVADMSALIPEVEIAVDSSSKAFVFASLPPITAVRDKQLLVEKLHQSFAANQPAEFNIKFLDEKNANFKPKTIEAKLVDPIGNEIALDAIFNAKLEEESIGEYFISIPPKRSFKPGAYSIVVIADDENFSYSDETPFMWGVLAVNTKKSIYKPGETAQFEIVVLDELSFGVCDADMEIVLNISSPDGNNFQLTKSNGQIEQLPECGVFKAEFPVQIEGTHKVSALASFRNIQNQIETDFLVKQNYDYDIIRNTQTKIDPKGTPESVEIIIDSFGIEKNIKIVEKVPIEFEVFNTDAQIDTNADTKTLTWIKKINSPITLSYNYQAPQRYPWLYYIGQIEIIEDNFVPVKEINPIEIPVDNNSTIDANSPAVEPIPADNNSVDANLIQAIKIPFIFRNKIFRSAEFEKQSRQKNNNENKKNINKINSNNIIRFEDVVSTISQKVFTEARPWMIAVDANPTSRMWFRNEADINFTEVAPNDANAPTTGISNNFVSGVQTIAHMNDVVGANEQKKGFSTSSVIVANKIKMVSFVSPPLIPQTINSGTWTAMMICQRNTAGITGSLWTYIVQWLKSTDSNGTTILMPTTSSASCGTNKLFRTSSGTGAQVTFSRGDKIVVEIDMNVNANGSIYRDVNYFWGGAAPNDSNITLPSNVTFAGDLNTTITTANDATIAVDFNVPINFGFDINGATSCRNYDCSSTDTNIQFCPGSGCTNPVDMNSSSGGLKLFSGIDTNQSSSPHTAGATYNVGWTPKGITNGIYRIRTRTDANQSGDVNTSIQIIDVNVAKGVVRQAIFSPSIDNNTYTVNVNFNLDVFVGCDSNGGCGNVDTNMQYCPDAAGSCIDSGGPWLDINSSSGLIQLVSGIMPDNNSNLSGNIRTYDANWVAKATTAGTYELRSNIYGNSITTLTANGTNRTIIVNSGAADTTFALSLPSSGCTNGKGRISSGSGACEKGYFEATDLTGTADENQVNPEGQTSTIPFFVYDNQSTSSSDLNISLDLNAVLPAAFRFKAAQANANYAGSCTGAMATNCLDISLNPADKNVGKATYTTGTLDLNIWLWADFVAAAGGASEDRNAVSTSTGS